MVGVVDGVDVMEVVRVVDGVVLIEVVAVHVYAVLPEVEGVAVGLLVIVLVAEDVTVVVGVDNAQSTNDPSINEETARLTNATAVSQSDRTLMSPPSVHEKSKSSTLTSP